MKILRYCSILLLLAVLLPGSAEGIGWKKPFNKVKISDLAPKDHSGDAKNSIVNVCVYVFELDRDQYPSVLAGLGEANDLSVKYEDSGSFFGNGLVSGGGDRDTWRKFAQILTDAQARMIKRVNLYMNQNIDNDVAIIDMEEPGNVCYRSGKDTSAEIGFPAGTVWLRINAKSLIGLKQICGLDITPIYKARMISDKNRKEQESFGWEFIFGSTAINVPVWPGQFVCIAPNTANFPLEGLPITGKMMFCSDKPKPVIRFCLIACSLIND